jgi:hypothetical protein
MEVEINKIFSKEYLNVRTEIVDGVNRQIKWMVTFAAGWTTLLVTLVRLIP